MVTGSYRSKKKNTYSKVWLWIPLIGVNHRIGCKTEHYFRAFDCHCKQDTELSVIFSVNRVRRLSFLLLKSFVLTFLSFLNICISPLLYIHILHHLSLISLYCSTFSSPAQPFEIPLNIINAFSGNYNQYLLSFITSWTIKSIHSNTYRLW